MIVAGRDGRYAVTERIIESQQKALIAANAAVNKHAEDLVLLDLRKISGVTDYFLICTATNSRQMGAVRDEIDDELRRNGQRVWHVEGTWSPRAGSRKAPKRQASWQWVSSSARSASSSGIEPGDEPLPDEGFAWMLMDFGDVVVHILNPAARTFYQIEHLWGDAPRVTIDASAAARAGVSPPETETGSGQPGGRA